MTSFLDLKVHEYRNHTILLDVDGTLCEDGGEVVSRSYVEKVHELSLHNTVLLFSNGRIERNLNLAKILGISVISFALRKPFVWFKQDIQKPVLVVGDKYTTDGLCAGLRGYSFFKVSSLRKERESLFTRFTYGLDRLIGGVLPYVLLLRPHQWVKNILVFTPAFFAGVLFTPSYFVISSLLFVTFCLVASLVYLVNDIADRVEDRMHPKKKQRPIASGLVSLPKAYTMIGVLFFSATFLSFFIPHSIPVFLSYILLNILYSWYFKKEPVLDTISVAVFYCLRILAGGLVLGIFLSPWIMLCVFFGSLFVILGKRLGEYDGGGPREVLQKYSKDTLLLLYGASLSLSLLTYALYTVLGHSDHPNLVYSTLFVALALFRMSHLVGTGHESSEAPELLVFKDKIVFLSFIFWLIFVGVVFY